MFWLQNQLPALLLAGLYLCLTGCSGHGGEIPDAHEGHDHSAHAEHDEPDEPDEHEEEGDGHDGHEGHGHGESGGDLEKSVAALFAQECEHDMFTHECDECRYEVGVVKAPADLVKSGLFQIARAKNEAVRIPLRLTGEVQFDDRRVTHVSTQVSGVIRKVHVTLGEQVTEGQPLLEIESVEVGNAKAVYQEALAMEKLARQNFDRIEKLQQEGIASQKEAMLARQELDAASIRVTAARGVLTRIGMGGGKKRGVNPGGSSGRLVLSAPADGTVLEMHAVSGEVARADDSLVTIGDNATLWVWADLYETNYAIVSDAQSNDVLDAEVFVKAFPGRAFAGAVDFISPAMSKISRTVKVRIAVPNPDGRLLAGMFADVDIFIPGNESAMSLPASAVMEDDDRIFVFVHHEGDYYVRRPVKIGRRYGSRVEVLEGLDGAEMVIADGAFLMKSDVLRSKMGAGCAH